MSDHNVFGRYATPAHPVGMTARRGVILLVVMVLLAMMALLGLTLVLVTAQGRLNALAAARNNLQSERDTQELASALVQVVAGSNDPNSSFGAHGLLEDLYGLPQFFGRIVPNTPVLPLGETAAGAVLLSGSNNGSLLQFAIAPAELAGAGGLGPQTVAQYILPQNSGAFGGQVITMLTGPAAGQSARIVGYYYVQGSAVNNPPFGNGIIQASSFGGLVPNAGDEFMINGRPFAGTGFGLDLTRFQPGVGQTGWVPPYTQPGSTPNQPLLTALESFSNGGNANVPMGMPYAYQPNHARLAFSNWSPSAPSGTYWDAAGPGGANEPYDAPDFQNLMLAMHYWSPYLLPSDIASMNNSGHVITPIPSLHRPELVAWFYSQALGNPSVTPPVAPNATISMANPAMRRKVILRPEPTDHQFVDSNGNGVWDAREPWHDVNGDLTPNDAYADGTPAYMDLNGNGRWDAGEADYAGNLFNPVTGCWFIAANGGWALDTFGLTKPLGLDVDNDADGIPDSIWVDAGLPTHTESDGTVTKNLVAVLCIDLDGKVNLNAHGTLAQLDVNRYAATATGTTPSGPYAPTITTAAPYVTVNPAPNPYSDGLFQRTIPVGQGDGPADVNPLHLFVRSHNLQNIGGTWQYVNNGGTAAGATFPSLSAIKYYQTFLQGFNYQAILAAYNGYAGSGATPPILQVDGRYGESGRLTVPPKSGFTYPGVFPPGSYYPPYPSGTPLTWTQQILNGPRPGWSQWFDPYATSQLVSAGISAYWVNDAVALARFSDIRPGLLTPPALGIPPAATVTPFFFDFLDSYTPGTTTLYSPFAATPGAYHLPTAHGTPSDLHSRGFLATDLTGRPYYGGTSTLPWQVTGLQQAVAGAGVGWQPAGFLNYWHSTMTDLAATLYDSAPLTFLSGETVLNEGVDTQYELNLTQNARQIGENTGNSIGTIPDLATVDAKLSPTELEAILRAHEWGNNTSADPSKLQVKRLTDLETAWYYLTTGSATNQTTTNLGKDNARLALTSESWDLPMPNLALTPRQMQDLTQYVNYFSGTTTPLGYYTGIGNASLNLNNVSLVELARARILADNSNPATTPATITGNLVTSSTTPYATDLALFGNVKNIQQGVLSFPLAAGPPPVFPVWPLLAPEAVLGMRLDVNRALGNGQDDNGNGVVDEPMEVFWQVQIKGTPYFRGEAIAYPYSQINAGTTWPVGQINSLATQQNNTLGILDLNNDGFYPVGVGGTTSVDPQLTAQTGAAVNLPADPTGADSRARQLLARHLYCLAMLLLDDRPYLIPNAGGPPTPNPVQNVMAQVFNALGATLPTGWPNYQALAQGAPGTLVPAGVGSREQAAYVIAQWAINVVDFRDRDSIMTPFEFDLYPFRADDPTQPNVTWNVDDIIDPASTPAPGGLQAGSKNDDTMAWRGLVWGCERPELLMTETVAFHDRGTADTSNAQSINDQSQTPPTGPDQKTGSGSMPADYDFDQVRRPRGSLIVELFNPTSYWDPPQLDMQTNGTSISLQPWNSPDINGNEGTGVNVAQVAAGQPLNNTNGPLRSPVWRIVVAYSPWQQNEKQCYTAPTGVPPIVAGGSGWNTSPAGLGTQVDPRVPILPPGAIHRAVYFTPFQQGFINGNTGIPSTASTVADTYLNDSFFADPDVFGPAFNPATGLNSVGAAAALLVPPGQYALVGPGNVDITGSTGNYYVFAGTNNPKTGNVNVYPWQLQLGNLPTYKTTAYVYGGTAGALTAQGPYLGTYGGTAATSATMKPVIGVPIQTNWFQNISGPTYAIHNSAGLAGASAGTATGVLTTLRMSVSEPEHGYPVWQGGTVPAGGVTPAPNMAALQDDAAYYNPGSPYSPAAGFGNLPQHPFDSGQGQPTGNPPCPYYLQFNDLPNPYVAPGTTAESTTLGYTVLYLQRLANPLQAWDEKLNPYITVDSMPVDLTAYTGESSAIETAVTYNGGVGQMAVLGSNPNPTGAAGPWTISAGTSDSFDTRRRGYDVSGNLLLGSIAPMSPVPNIWAPLPTPAANPYTTPGTGKIVATGSTFMYKSYGSNGLGKTATPMPMGVPTSSGGTGAVGSTLGFANWEYSYLPSSVTATVPPTSILYTAGGAAAAVGTSGMPAYMYNGDPLLPFPWLTWNNRPYASQFELMLVPASSPSSQLEDFGMLGWAASGASFNEYLPYAPAASGGSNLTPTATMLPAAQFMQLLNFFNNEQTLSATDTTNLLPNLYRIFEFLQVPSRYTGTQDLLDPSQFAGDNAVQVADAAGAGLPSASHLFHTPFNWLPRYRDPGRVNLNTIFDPVVFQSLTDDYPGALYATGTNPITGFADAMLQPAPTSLWSSVAGSRQGFAIDTTRFTPMYSSAPPNPVSQFAFNSSTTPPKPGANADVPTYFANPFRPDGSGALVPQTSASNPAVSRLMHQWTYPAAGLYNGVNATLMRSALASSFPGSTTAGPLALFDDTAFDSNNAGVSYLSTSTTTPIAATQYRHAGQNAAFQYQMFTRLGNTTTNRSNVYAIWITLGKFQVQHVGVNPSNPDGYKLVAPYVDGQGNQYTTRGFYIFDRSIPMGFQRGQDVNTEKGMLVERVLQLPQ